MGRLIFGMMQSLDGYIDGPAGDVQLGPPGPISFAISPITSVARTAFSTADACMRSCVTGMRTSRGGTRSSMISPKPGVRSRSRLHHGL
jgi:hypothetical protein